MLDVATFMTLQRYPHGDCIAAQGATAEAAWLLLQGGARKHRAAAVERGSFHVDFTGAFDSPEDFQLGGEPEEEKPQGLEGPGELIGSGGCICPPEGEGPTPWPLSCLAESPAGPQYGYVAALEVPLPSLSPSP